MTANRRSRFTLPLILTATLMATGCAAGGKSPAARRGVEATPPPDAQHPVIVRLVGRHYTVTASSGPSGVVYSAVGRGGNLIVANASLEELRQRHPKVYEQIIPGIATKGETDDPRRRDVAEDASIDGPIPLGHVGHPATGLGTRGDAILMDARRDYD